MLPRNSPFTRPGRIYQVEIDAEEKYQLEISFQKDGSNTDEICRVFITCEETKEEGCRSEFERLIKLNRRPIENFDTKAVVQLDRHARLSAMQSWMLDENSVAKSFIPVVISDDYASKWASPDWDSQVRSDSFASTLPARPTASGRIIYSSKGVRRRS